MEKTKRDYGVSYNPNSEGLVTAGGTEAIFLALLALINPDDEVLVPDPGFVCYEPGVLMAGGVPVSMPMLEKDNFRLDADVVMSLITGRSRVMLINTPNNPPGAVLSYDDIAGLAKLAVERDLIVISDEVYEKITYDGAWLCFWQVWRGSVRSDRKDCGRIQVRLRPFSRISLSSVLTSLLPLVVSMS